MNTCLTTDEPLRTEGLAPVQRRVLTVDDCPVTRLLLRVALEGLGWRVEAAESGRAALEAVARQRFDAVVLDVEMPDLDGMAVGQALRTDPRHATTLIAMHSSLDEDRVRMGFRDYDAFVPKVADPLALGERLNRALQGSRRAA